MSAGRLPAHMEVTGLIRAVEAAGGIGTVVSKGERDAGVILLLTMDRGGKPRLWERLPRLDGRREFALVREQDDQNKQEFDEYLQRRTARDPDLWVIELDIADAERFVAEFAR